MKIITNLHNTLALFNNLFMFVLYFVGGWGITQSLRLVAALLTILLFALVIFLSFYFLSKPYFCNKNKTNDHELETSSPTTVKLKVINETQV